MGTTLLTHAANLFLITMGGLKHGTVPIFEKGTSSYVDPIPQALILTAIVIANRNNYSHNSSYNCT